MADDDASSTIEIASSGLRANIARRGAELVRLRDADGRDLLWGGDPAFWTGRSPLLFPIVGRLKDDVLMHGRQPYPMKQHGFVRGSTLALASAEASACRLDLRPDDSTRHAYPYAFTFAVTYRVEGSTLSIEVEVTNPGAEILPASVGFHPAFRWPLPYGEPREAHAITFAQPEPGPVRRLEGGLLTPTRHPSPVDGCRLALRDDLFAADALIFLEPASRSLRFGPPGGPALRVDFPDMPHLGLWTKPGAGFLCVEPWYGYASPEDFDGDFSRKPGLCLIPPGGLHRFAMAVTLEGTA